MSRGLLVDAESRVTEEGTQATDGVTAEADGSGPNRQRGWRLAVKRSLDVTLAAIGVAVTVPLLLLVALAIKVQDGGPVLFRQERVGKGGRRFVLYKFRTMVTDAEERLTALRESNGRAEPLFKLAVDPRVTRVGRVLRASSLDELPQLFNVLAGRMSLVGPRPALPTEVAQFDDELLARHRVLPGITGLWQVNARDNPSFEAYRFYDLHYVDHWSLKMDLRMIAATPFAVLGRLFRVVRRSAWASSPERSPGLEGSGDLLEAGTEVLG